jgi:hypothetical protein|tara:strand:+ start:9469 stop:9741 length:273 start_codon:yes stop_codon:yes gene_type:complete
MGLQGKRWPKWKQRRDNSGQDITDENRVKKLHHGVKCIKKVGVFDFSRPPLDASGSRLVPTSLSTSDVHVLTIPPPSPTGFEKSSNFRGA